MGNQPGYAVRELADLVADPDAYAGGGVIAAASLAGAAATAELVAALASRRKKLSEDDRRRLVEVVAMLQLQRERYLDAIDEDIDALQRLMAAMRQERKSRNTNDAQAARAELARSLQWAIEIPIQVARDGVELLEAVSITVPLSRAFTRSDLGAAAATANGAVAAMLLMARANLDMVDDPTARNRWRRDIERLESTAQALSDRIVASARGDAADGEGS
jgi:formiminotetrahydrofolate cyclodeaminase